MMRDPKATEDSLTWSRALAVPFTTARRGGAVWTHPTGKHLRIGPTGSTTRRISSKSMVAPAGHRPAKSDAQIDLQMSCLNKSCLLKALAVVASIIPDIVGGVAVGVDWRALHSPISKLLKDTAVAWGMERAASAPSATSKESRCPIFMISECQSYLLGWFWADLYLSMFSL